ncbi:MAG: adenine/guanine/hypoxanthine permease, partial [Pseudonocardiales bacterium]|nr:adenine/guanine/hypoxanthine permease [Pseudonocardiales bacterium]
TVAIIPFTYSITNGIGAGLVSYVVLRVCKGRWPGWLMTGLALMFAVYFGVDVITGK